jgi:hypothetical protein
MRKLKDEHIDQRLWHDKKKWKVQQDEQIDKRLWHDHKKQKLQDNEQIELSHIYFHYNHMSRESNLQACSISNFEG